MNELLMLFAVGLGIASWITAERVVCGWFEKRKEFREFFAFKPGDPVWYDFGTAWRVSVVVGYVEDDYLVRVENGQVWRAGKKSVTARTAETC